jgi:hypothetical protein
MWFHRRAFFSYAARHSTRKESNSMTRGTNVCSRLIRKARLRVAVARLWLCRATFADTHQIFRRSGALSPDARI